MDDSWTYLGRIADSLGVIGFFITIVGFVVTIWAARSAKSAAEDARKAISHFDAVAATTEAIAVIEEIIRLHRSASLHILPDRYLTLKKLLIQIRHTVPEIEVANRASITGIIAQVKEISGDIEDSIEDETTLENTARIIGVLTDQHERILELQGKIRKQTGHQP